MLRASRNFSVARTRGAIELLRQDGITGVRAWIGLLWFMWVKPGMMRKIFSAWAKFFLPGFHPWNEDDRHLIRQYEAEATLGTGSAKKVRRAAA
jgi:predicted metal-dependent hydrolase